MNDFTDMHNPYELSTKQSNMAKPKKRVAFLVGARNGFLWSLILAVPFSTVCYDKAIRGMAIRFDPITFARTKVPLTNAHRMSACFDAIVTATGYIVLPWSLAAGVVKHIISNRTKESLDQQRTETEEI